MADLSNADRERLLALLRKMLESIHDGEAIAVLGMLRKEATKRDTTAIELIEQVVGTRIRTVTVHVTPGWEEPRSLVHAMAIALRFEKVLNAWEYDFATSCASRSTLSEKQAVQAQKIINKVRTYVGA